MFILIYTAMQEILRGNGLVDLPGLARRMLQKRRGIIHKKEQLRCCYDAMLCFAEEYLQKRKFEIDCIEIFIGRDVLVVCEDHLLIAFCGPRSYALGGRTGV